MDVDQTTVWYKRKPPLIKLTANIGVHTQTQSGIKVVFEISCQAEVREYLQISLSNCTGQTGRKKEERVTCPIIILFVYML